MTKGYSMILINEMVMPLDKGDIFVL